MKPWEGKHWKKAQKDGLDRLMKCEMRAIPAFSFGYILGVFTDALKKDWEEQMDSLTPQGRALLDMIMNKGRK